MKPRWIACFILLCGVWGIAYGQTGYSLNETLDSNADWTVTIHSNDGGYSGGVYAGPYDATWNTTHAPQGYSKDMTVFCADIRHYDQSPSTVTLIPFTASTDGSLSPDSGSFSSSYTSFTYNYASLERAAWLYDNYLPAVQSASGVEKQIDGAALQIAIWKAIETDSGNSNPVDTSTDFFWISPYDTTNYDSICSRANTWYSKSANQKASGTLFLAEHSGQYYQNMLGPAMAPELPGSLLLLSGLILPSVLLMRRKQHGMR
jgi:hypothetical protein